MSAGFAVTVRHFFQAVFNKRRKSVGAADDNYFEQDKGIVTLQYPHESIPVPDNGRYRLHNEIDDCIVCDKCAKVCPVNCIDIEPVKSTEEIRKTSDGSSVRLYAAKFDIDMAKCMYCGLCTTVCPTECLTMTKTYDYSEFDIRNMNYKFSEMTPNEVDEKQKDYEVAQEAKLKAREEAQALKAAQVTTTESDSEVAKQKPVFKPKIGGLKKPVIKAKESSDEATPKPTPAIKPIIKKADGAESKPKPKPVIKPVIKKASDTGDAKPKPVIKPVIKKVSPEGEQKKAVIKPVIKPLIKKKSDDKDE